MNINCLKPSDAMRRRRRIIIRRIRESVREKINVFHRYIYFAFILKSSNNLIAFH